MLTGIDRQIPACFIFRLPVRATMPSNRYPVATHNIYVPARNRIAQQTTLTPMATLLVPGISKTRHVEGKRIFNWNLEQQRTIVATDLQRCYCYQLHSRSGTCQRILAERREEETGTCRFCPQQDRQFWDIVSQSLLSPFSHTSVRYNEFSAIHLQKHMYKASPQNSPKNGKAYEAVRKASS